MKKNELLDKVLEIKNHENEDLYQIDNTGREFNYFFAKRLIRDLLFLSLLLIIAILLNSKISKLSFISPNVYYALLIGFIIILLGIFIPIYACFFKYQRHSILYTNSYIIKVNRFYEAYDIISFILKAFFSLYAVFMFALTPALVSGRSMMNTYHDNDRVLVWHLGYHAKNNDVVIIDATSRHYAKLQDETAFLIKRIIASEGDRVRYADGKLYVNEQIVHEDSHFTLSVYQNMLTDQYNHKSYYHEGEVIIPKGFYIAMGDNRVESFDSRAIGLIHSEDILGKSIFRIYPFAKIGVPKKNFIL